uniref:Uncharacterized protein n=1 Tax=Tanacetum cinerariifolium TaxID=118510 RepID=A0A699I3V4_TANCI|nr:hypothetical protein [Tanacetum cinerariifolium]
MTAGRTKSKEQDTRSRSGNAHDDDADIRHIYDEEPMAEVQMTAEINVFAIGQQHTQQPEFNKEGEGNRCHNHIETNQLSDNRHRLSLNDLEFQSLGMTPKLMCMSKPVTTHYLPKEREAASTKPHHMIAYRNSRISLKNIPRFSLNDMVHNHYLEEAKKRTQECSRNSEPSLITSARSKSTVNEHSRNSRNFFDSKHFVCSTCQKCVFSATHDSCVTKFLKEVNSRAKVPSHKTTNINKPVEQISVPKKQERQILTGHRFSIQKTSVVQKKTMTLRSCLRWKPKGKIFKTVSLRWVLTGRILTSRTIKVDSEPLNGLNVDITYQYEYEQTLDVSACTSNLSAGTSFDLKEKGLRVWLLERQISHKPGLQRIFI